MADPSYSVLHLTMRRADRVLSVGSGVLHAKEGRFFIATAWHNLSGRNSETFVPLSKQLAVPDNVVVVVPLISRETGDIFRMSITLPLQDDDEATYLIHPHPWPRKDVAVLEVNPDAAYPFEGVLSDGTVLRHTVRLRQASDGVGISTDIQPIQACAGTFSQIPEFGTVALRAGDELFVLGYPRGITDHTGTPIWKRATIATDPRVGWYRQPCFLIDCASREGMSGAPVVLYSRSGSVRKDGMVHLGSEPSAILCGIYVGRLKDPDAQPDADGALFEAQLGRVWKAEVIDEIIKAGQRGPHPDHITASLTAIDAALMHAWAKEHGNNSKHLRLPAVRHNIVNGAIVALNANVKPADVYGVYDAKVQAIEDAAASNLEDT